MNIICYLYYDEWSLRYSIVVSLYGYFLHRANNFVLRIQGEEGTDFLTVSGQPENNLSEDKDLGSLVDNSDLIFKKISYILSEHILL